MKIRNASFYVLATVLSVFLLLLAAELATRGISWASGKGFRLGLHELNPKDAAVQSNYVWHPFTGVIFRPRRTFEVGHAYQEEKARVFVDGQGFLVSPGPQLPVEKAPNEIRIATIGGSTTANLNLSFEENWPGILAALLRERFPERKISVINAGIPGFDTAQSIGNLALRVMPYQPDIVIVYHAYNDLKAVRADDSFVPDYSHIHPKPFGSHIETGWMESLLESSMLYVRARNRKSQVTELKQVSPKKAGRLPDVPARAATTFEQHMRALAGIARSGNAQVVFPSFATLHDTRLDYRRRESVTGLSKLKRAELLSLLHYTPGLTVNGVLHGIREYNERVRGIADNENVFWVDTAAAMGHDDKFYIDRVHFSREGARKFAEILLPRLIALASQR